jgi:hypothetical protein
VVCSHCLASESCLMMSTIECLLLQCICPLAISWLAKFSIHLLQWRRAVEKLLSEPQSPRLELFLSQAENFERPVMIVALQRWEKIGGRGKSIGQSSCWPSSSPRCIGRHRARHAPLTSGGFAVGVQAMVEAPLLVAILLFNGPLLLGNH